MAKMKQIHDFAVKWLNKFRDLDINYIELIDPQMSDDCASLGFKDDFCPAFYDNHGQATYNYETFDKIINDATDIMTLGSAIYSNWRYFSHWAYSSKEILEPKNRELFITALSRLASLSIKNPSAFQGVLKKMRIVSNNVSYGPIPRPDEETEQRITVNNDGRVWFSGYNFGLEYGKHQKARSKNFKIKKASAEKLLNAIADYFKNGYSSIVSADIGYWKMELTNTEGVTYIFRGSLCAAFDYDGEDLSDLVRDTLDMSDLYVFDGNYTPDIINRIVVDYRRDVKIHPKGTSLDRMIYNYRERLIIDRETETLEHIQNIGTDCKISCKYEIKNGIKSLLRTFDADDLFSRIKNTPCDAFDAPNETKSYTITVDYKKKPRRVVVGNFYKNGLPEDFAYFAENTFDFIQFYGLGEILNPSVYEKINSVDSEYIFCSVTFNDECKSYYYLTDDDTVEVGDFVIVPVGKDNRDAVVKVVKVERFRKENVPIPLEKMKQIVCKLIADNRFDKHNQKNTPL